MLKNYLKIAVRHISRNKGYVFINVMGLGIALACSMIAFVNWQAGENADSFHENCDRIFRVVANGVGHTQPTADITAPLVSRAAAEISGIEAGVRFHKNGVIIQNGETVFGERLALADANFFEVFTYKALSGDVNAIKDPSKIIISQKKAESYFGDEPAVGKTLIINPGQPTEKQLVVGAVLENFKTQTVSLRFDFLTNISLLETVYNRSLADWRTSLNASFVLLKNPAESQQIAQDLAKYIPIRNEASSWNQRVNFLFQPMNRVFMDGRKVNNNELGRAIAASFYWAPGLMALLILLTACLNFTNTTISFSNKRLKEMGVRKVMGGGRSQLIAQLLGESLVICLLAACVGIVLAEYLTPIYNAMWGSMELALQLDYFHNKGLLIFLISIILMTTLLGGIYPAFYISSFRPAHIFRGNTKFGGDNWLIRSLLGLQIIISLVAIIGGITMVDNAEFQKNYDLGYNVNGVINVDLQNWKQYERFKNIILENANIEGVTGSASNLGFDNWDNFVGQPEDQRQAKTHEIGIDFLEVMDLKLVEGRTFDENLATDRRESVLVTEKFVKESNWVNPLGKKVKHRYEQEKNVIGVVADFYSRSFYEKPRAAVFHLAKPEWLRVMKIKVKSEKLAVTKKYLQEKWSQHFPLVPFNSYYQDQTLAEAFNVTKNVSLMYLFLAIVSILLAATGLFSLVSLNVLKRSKEIAVRRVLGASAESITYTINKHYILVFAVGSIIGAIIGNWLTVFLLERVFEVVKGVSLFSIMLSVIGICAIGALTIGGRLFGVLQTNPADTLKSE